jgi:pre-mRNA-processing factor 6
MTLLSLWLQQQQADVVRRCVEADPRYGEQWTAVAKDVRNWRMTTAEKLQDVVKRISVQ